MQQEYMILIIIAIGAIGYWYGYYRGTHIQWGIANDNGLYFESGKNIEETKNKIQSILRENSELKKQVEELKNNKTTGAK